MQNYLKNQTSPYLLQHADNPVNWYPWCEEAFERARREDKPIFLSIGYSTCHWCHVMAHESFEDMQVAEILNQHFISIKVDKEERPDIDSIYMAVCQTFTGNGGWPTTIFLTPDQKPFFAGTYFPKNAEYGQIGFMDLLQAVHNKWKTDRKQLLETAEEVLSFLKGREIRKEGGEREPDLQLAKRAFHIYRRTFDAKYGGFGNAPKFPTPHTLLFLIQCFEMTQNADAMNMVEKTLLQMYRGGIFDHIGGGFSRYSTDPYFLVPHFEKMLYDNALLIMAYSKAYQVTGKYIYLEVAERTAAYVAREMTSHEGGFFCAQDADSEGIEGKYYLLDAAEIKTLLGEAEGGVFNRYFDITEAGNFEGKNIPNLLKNDNYSGNCCKKHLNTVYDYRRGRYELHLDDKILTSWNGLMITAMCHLYRVTENKSYLDMAQKSQEFIQSRLCEEDTLHISWRQGIRSGKGFLDDYANEIWALLALYEATLERSYLEQGIWFCEKAITDFYDEEQDGFFLYGRENEQLILRSKETYDGAIPSGNSVMAYNLVRLFLITNDERYERYAERLLKYLCREAEEYPAGHAMFLIALQEYLNPPEKITVVGKEKEELGEYPCRLPLGYVLNAFCGGTKEYPLKNDKTTFYVCKGRSCLPPQNEWDDVISCINSSGL
ncbi:MAG: thioredoxin domain-containing protein [Lachnospiraceae bacterium]|nr:thioredoxin domain-containing protein [Lachnospiraceae bacterium]